MRPLKNLKQHTWFIRAEAEAPICWPPDASKPTHWKRAWWWERLKAKGEEGGRGWDGWMASLTQWTHTWANFRRWWRTGGLPCCSPWGHKESDVTEQLKNSMVHAWFPLHGVDLKCGTEGRSLACAGAGEDSSGGVKTQGPETPTITLDSMFTSVLTAAFPGSSIIKSLPRLSHLGIHLHSDGWGFPK